MRVHSFALRYRMESLTRLAAREFLAVENLSIFAMDSDELEDLSIAAYRRLLVYRERCAARIKENSTLWQRSGKRGTWTWNACPACVDHGYGCKARSR